MHAPEVLILDEPTLGLDPLMQREFWRMVDEAVACGATVLLSSHVLTEVELGCDRIGLIREGRLVKIGSLAELRTVFPAPFGPMNPKISPREMSRSKSKSPRPRP